MSIWADWEHKGGASLPVIFPESPSSLRISYFLPPHLLLRYASLPLIWNKRGTRASGRVQRWDFSRCHGDEGLCASRMPGRPPSAATQWQRSEARCCSNCSDSLRIRLNAMCHYQKNSALQTDQVIYCCWFCSEKYNTEEWIY